MMYGRTLDNREAKEWETGGSQRLVIDSALNVISTALAGRPAAEVVASGLSPAVNNQIKKATTDAKGNVNTALNLTAHALWGAVEAYAGNRNVAAGAAGAAGGEAAANFLASTLYDKSPEKLSEEEKRTVSSLSQVAAGIAGGSLSDSSDGAIIAAKMVKDAVENNNFALDSVMNNPQVDWLANAKAQEKISEADRQAMDAFEKAHPDIVKNLKQTGDVASFVADFIPVAGDIKSFAEAEDGIDYALAFIGVVSGSEVIVKPLKAAKASIQKAKVAESLGNTADVIKHQKKPENYTNSEIRRKKEMVNATLELKAKILDGSINKSTFTDIQLEQIMKGKDKIDGFTWHHNAQSSPNNMQLVPTNIHDAVKHIGEGALSEGR